MKVILKYILTEFKKYVKLIPYTIFSGGTICAILLFIGIFNPNAMYGENQINKIKIYVVSEENTFITNALSNFVGEMESFKDYVEIEITDEETAKEKLESGEAYAIVQIPKNTLSGILNGTNSPAKIILNQNLSEVELKVFKEITENGNKILSVAQASVYSAAQLCRNLRISNKIGESEDYVNNFYLKTTMNRNKIFEIEEVLVGNKISLAEYYIISGIMIFITFVAISYGYFFKNKPTAIEKLIHSYGKKYYSIYICQTVAFAFLVSILGIILLIGIHLIGRSSDLIDFKINFLSAIIVMFSISCFIKMIIQIFGNNNLAFIFIFFIVILFICGEFIPSIFLPVWTNPISKIMPYYYWRQDIVNIIKTGNFNVIYSLFICLFSIFIGSVHYNFLANKWRDN